jgi:HlyD family secretion protein
MVFMVYNGILLAYTIPNNKRIMDTVIEKKRFTPKRILTISLITIVVITIITISAGFELFSYEIDKSRVTIKDVTYGPFEDIIMANGTVEPKTTVLVNVIEGGMVEEIFAEDGAMVQAGQPLVKISNPNVSLRYMTQETATIEQINNLRNTRLIIENTQRDLNDKLYLQEKDFFEAERQYKMDTALYRKGVIAKNDYLKSVESYEYHKKRTALIKTSVVKEIKNREQQLERLNTSINLMERNLEILRKNRSNLTVKSPITGRLSSFNPVLGQNYNSGQTMGKINVLDGFIIRAFVSEYYINKVREGQKAICYINDNEYELTIKKVLPEVSNNEFQIDLGFNSELKDKITRGQTLSVKIQFADKINAIRLPKGMHFQSTGGKWVFVVNNNHLEKREIKIGRNNNEFYEVLSGLQEGEKIVTSSYNDYKERDKVILK